MIKNMAVAGIGVILLTIGLTWADAPATSPAATAPATTQIGGVTWTDDYDQALIDAKRDGMKVLLDFTGSDWCQPCIALKKNVLTSDAFNAWAKGKIICVELDYPHNVPQSDELKARNKRVLTAYNGNMMAVYPTVIILDSNGKEIGRNNGYNPAAPISPADWIALMEKKMAAK